MKKRMLALLLGLLCAGLTACGSTDTAAKDETPSAPSVEQPEPEPTPEEVRRTAAEQYADGLTLEEQVAQMFFVRCPETDAAALTAQYDIGGYLLFARDFDGQTKESVANTIAAYRNAAKTPMLIGVEDDKLEHCLEIIGKYSKSRKQLIPSSAEAGISFYPSMPVEVVVGGATIFVLDVEQFKKV